MPNVAQKLCHDIVEPVLKQSTANIGRVKSTNKPNNSSSTLKQNVKPTKFVHIDRKTSSKTKALHTDGITKPSILKSLADTAVNTLVSGPLRCDNNCITLVRKRDHHSSCKCGNKSSKTNCKAKSIQTILNKDFSRIDRACMHCIQTATCGTQFLDKNCILGIKKTKSKSHIGLVPEITRIETNLTLDRYLNNQRDPCNHHVDNKMSSFRYVTPKRWALSNYPIRGPDF